MTLREKRCLFTVLISQLIEHIASTPGYSCAFNEVYRDPRIAQLNAKSGKGISRSNHLVGLAADINLYYKGIYQTTTEAHKQFGEWWEKLNPLCRWGGRFSRPDGNHYSFFHDGVS